MHIKVAELVGESRDGWQDAVDTAVGEAAQKLGSITGVEVVNFTANVKNGRVTEYKTNLKIAYTE